MISGIAQVRDCLGGAAVWQNRSTDYVRDEMCMSQKGLSGWR